MDEESKPPAKANLASDAPSALPPATGGAARGTSPVVWIVAAIVGALAVGGVLFGCVICAGVAFLISPTNVPSEMEYVDYVDSKSGPTPYNSYPTPVETMPIDAWNAPGYSGDLSTEGSIDPYAATPADAVPADATYEQTYSDSIFAEPEASYDPDWQLELPQYQQDAIRDLNNQRETFGSP